MEHMRAMSADELPVVAIHPGHRMHCCECQVTRALFSCEKLAFSFIYDKYYLIID